VEGRFFNYSTVNVHAPAEDSEEKVKEDFYDALEKAYDACPKNDIKIVDGDFNAQLGNEMTFRPTIGMHIMHENTNDNGSRLIFFAASRNMVIGTTLSPHKEIHKRTRSSPDGNTYNQIDHILIDSRHKSNLMDVRSHRGVNIDSDHYLVMSRIRVRLSSAKKVARTPQEKYNTALLLTPQILNCTVKDSHKLLKKSP
jgi:hypothetical protein